MLHRGEIVADKEREHLEQGRGNSKRQALSLIAICAGYFMVILDATAVTVAVPNIQQQLGATVSDLQWVLDGYTLAFAALLLTAGALGDRLGNKHVFLLGLFLFTASSALCGLAPTLWVLQVARVIQGVGAALQVPTSLALLNQTFHDPRERDRAIGLWGSIAGIAAAAGPVLGGILVSFLNWRSVFLLNLPIGIVAFVLTMCYLPAVPGLARRGLDFMAQMMAICALGLLTLAIIEGKNWGWTSWPILGAFTGFLLTGMLFLFIERRSTNPMLPLQLFSIPMFSAGNSVGLLINFGFYGQLLLINLFLQNILKYPPFITGLALLPEAGVVTLASLLSGRVTARFGPRWPMIIGLLLGTTGFWLMLVVQTSTPYLLLCPMLVAIGFGMSFTMPAMTTVVVASVPKERSGIASAVLNASRQVGSVLGYALLGSLVGEGATFIAGMHIAMGLSGASFLLACILTVLYVRTRQKRA